MSRVAALFWLSTAGTAWVYAGYPLAIAAAGHRAPRPRERAPVTPSVSVIIAAHDEERIIGEKVANVRATDYPVDRLQIIVASDGSDDSTVDWARRAGADVVLDLPRAGKLSALDAAVGRSSGEILVFTDADSMFSPATIGRLVSNFADPRVGGVAGNVLRASADGLGTGEGLYWRYEQWIKRMEDRVGSAVSATGQLYGIRRALYRTSDVVDGTDDFVISTEVVRAGYRLAFDASATVTTDPPQGANAELRRKVRLMNRGLRAAFSLGPLLLPWNGGLYAVQVFSHKILRRFVPFLLVTSLLSSAGLAARGRRAWLAAFLPQLGFFGLAALGAAGQSRSWGRHKLLTVPHYFCLANLAAALAVISVLRGRRFVTWQPDRAAAIKTGSGSAPATSTSASAAAGGRRPTP